MLSIGIEHAPGTRAAADESGLCWQDRSQLTMRPTSHGAFCALILTRYRCTLLCPALRCAQRFQDARRTDLLGRSRRSRATVADRAEGQGLGFEEGARTPTRDLAPSDARQTSPRVPTSSLRIAAARPPCIGGLAGSPRIRSPNDR